MIYLSKRKEVGIRRTIMKFSKKSRYGIIALIDLATSSKEDPISLSSIAERNNISLQYLEQIFASLRVAGIVRSIKGPQGGYLLNHKASEITVANIVDATDGGYHLEDEEIPEDGKAYGILKTVQSEIIDKVNKELDDLLINLTLSDLEKEYSSYKEYGQNMYYI